MAPTLITSITILAMVVLNLQRRFSTKAGVGSTKPRDADEREVSVVTQLFVENEKVFLPPMWDIVYEGRKAHGNISYDLGKTQKKVFFLVVGTTNGVGRVNPPDH